MAESGKSPWYRINTELLPVKGIYFTFLAGIGTLLPFIPVYMKQLGLSSTEAGIIYGVMPFVAFFVRPLFGAVADKLHQHKLVLMVCTFSTGVLYCLLLVTPAKSSAIKDIGNVISVRTQIQCNPIDSYIVDCEDVRNDSGILVLQNCEQSLRAFSPQLTDNSSHVKCNLSCGLSIAPLNLYACFTNDVTPNIDERCLDKWNDTGESKQLDFTVNDLAKIMKNEVLKPSMVYNGQTCANYDLKNISYNGNSYWQFTCNAEAVFDCKVICSNDPFRKCLTVTDSELSKTFWIFFIIFLLCNIFFSPVLSLVDAVAYDILGEKHGRWGKQRLWGTVGFALFAIASTSIMDMLSKSNAVGSFTVSFYIFLGLNIISTIVTYFLKFSETMHCSQMFKNITSLIKYPRIIVFLSLVVIFGIMNGVIEAFLFWYLQDLGGTQIIFGLCLVFNCTTEVFALLFSGKVIKKIGRVFCLYLALAAYSIRFFCYSFITNAWYVLPVELLHGFTFALMYAAASSYGSIITPEGMSGTVQGLIGGFHFGFGKGIGSFITGKLFDPVSGLGEVWTFRFYGFLALVVLILYAAVQILCFRESDEPRKSAEGGANIADQDGSTGAAGDQLLTNDTANNENDEL